jgi:hypothetical protein
MWANANVYAGYRYSVDARPGSGTPRGNVATIAVTWTNYGSAAATEKWIPAYQLVDFSDAVIRTIPSTLVLKNRVRDEGVGGEAMEPSPATATESVAVDLAGLAEGHYTLRAAVTWRQHKPDASHVVNCLPYLCSWPEVDATTPDGIRLQRSTYPATRWFRPASRD